MSGFILQVDSTTVTSIKNLGSGNIHQDILIFSLLLVMILLLAAAMVLLKAFKTMIRVTMPEVEMELVAAKAAKHKSRKQLRKDRWNKLMGLRPLAEEDDLIIDHSYDGIQELDNPIPVWFMSLFYASLVFAVVYIAIYQVFGIGMNQDQEYAREMVIAENDRKIYLASQADNVDENTVTLDKGAETLAAGKAIFNQNCVACHGGAGEGGIGPNLTDQYWLHGGSVKAVFKTVKHGVPDKGMIAWEQQLSPAQIAQVSNYIISLRGTNPPNGKAPQGESEETAASTETLIVTDTK